MASWWAYYLLQPSLDRTSLGCQSCVWPHGGPITCYNLLWVELHEDVKAAYGLMVGLHQARLRVVGRNAHLEKDTVQCKKSNCEYSILLKGLGHETEFKYFEKKWTLLNLNRSLYWFLNF